MNSLGTSQQFDSAQLISSLAERKHLVGRMWPSDHLFDLAGSNDMRLEKMLHYYLTWVASDPIPSFGKNIFSANFANGKTWCLWNNANEQLEECMESQSGELFDRVLRTCKFPLESVATHIGV